MEAPFDRAAGMDCCMFVADWVEACSGIDPAAHLRGTYTGPFGAARQIARYGDFENMWRVCMSVAGFNTTKAPQPGDVGVVLDAASNTVSAIRFAQAWAAKSESGVVIEDFRMIVDLRPSASLKEGGIRTPVTQMIGLSPNLSLPTPYTQLSVQSNASGR